MKKTRKQSTVSEVYKDKLRYSWTRPITKDTQANPRSNIEKTKEQSPRYSKTEIETDQHY